MLQIKEICKEYRTGDLVQDALDKVSLNLRDNEFVAVLGPSGSGKTTLLNVIGGLDHYDSGDLIINGISTKNYKDKDWDSYRNHTIGFVFQSYNLIPHQSVLANVELALTISGVSRSERKNRAAEALEQVGLGDQLHKKPSQMSGGQMQRVAIARALVNNPEILLADEPTGALDTETSVQVMELLKEVAKDRLVVMVTHNPELAEKYANRIVKLRDGKIIDDSNPFVVDEAELDKPRHESMGKSSMSILTALSLSFNNLRTKWARTILTAFAGSIGIIGIALILSLSNGVTDYIDDIQKSTMSSYPVSIDAQSMDLSSVMETGRSEMDKQMDDAAHELDGVYMDGSRFEMASTVNTSLTENNLTNFKKYLDDPDSEIHQYVGENGIVYSYDAKFGVYTHDPEGVFVNTDGSTLSSSTSSNATGMMLGSVNLPIMEMPGMDAMMPSTENFQEMLPDQKTGLVSEAVTKEYDLLYGSWPQAYDEVVLVLDKHNEISASSLYELGLLPSAEYKELVEEIDDGKEITLDSQRWSYEDICEKDFYMIAACDSYVENESGNFDYIAEDTEKMEELMESDSVLKLKIAGVVRPTEESENYFVTSPIGYTKALTDYIIDYTDNSAVVKAQKENEKINVINGYEFSPQDDATKISEAKAYISGLGVTDKATLGMVLLQQGTISMPDSSGGMTQEEMEAAQAQGMTEEQIAAAQAGGQGEAPAEGSQPGNATEEQLAALLEQYMESPDDETMLSVYDSYISSGSYDDNMTAFGVVSSDAPTSIRIYTDSFENKDGISSSIEDYNQTVSEENKITYTDYVGLLMSSVTTIINVISYVLIAFVAVSLVVSSIMIGIITYISVLERTKEIGILRAIGASKGNIAQVFNAETFIVGLCSGIIGIGSSLLLLIPGNMVIHHFIGSTDVNAFLPMGAAAILIVLSVILTLIGGLIPSKQAAKKDPVTALRSD